MRINFEVFYVIMFEILNQILMRKIVVIISLNFVLISAFAQKADTSAIIKQTGRLEIELSDDYQDFTVISGEEDGLMIVSDQGEEYFKGYEYSEGDFYLLFGKQEFRQEELSVIKYSAATGDTTTYNINTVFPIDLEYFEILGNTMIFGGYAFYKPVIMLFNTENKLPKVLPGVYNNSASILDIVPNEKLGVFSLIMSERLPSKQGTVTIKSYTSDGTPIQDRILNPGTEKSLLDAASTTFLSGYQYVAGTYAQRKTDYSRGLYLARLKNGIQESVTYHNYGNLENFFVHFSDKREKRVKERIKRRKALGKRIKFNYRLAIHDIIEQDDQYIMIGEAYYPRYRSNSDFNSGFRYAGFGTARGIPNSFNPYFIGYKYTHAVVVAFDKLGNVIWDNSFEINDVLTPTLKEYVKVKVDRGSEKIVLIYAYDNLIQSKVIEKGQIVEGKTINPIKLTYDFDKAKSTSKETEGVENWYDNTFFAFGKQRIKNSVNAGVRGSRKIFYINKIEYEKSSLLE